MQKSSKLWATFSKKKMPGPLAKSPKKPMRSHWSMFVTFTYIHSWTLPMNFRLLWMCLIVTNTLAYFEYTRVAFVKGFIEKVPDYQVNDFPFWHFWQLFNGSTPFGQKTFDRQTFGRHDHHKIDLPTSQQLSKWRCHCWVEEKLCRPNVSR